MLAERGWWDEPPDLNGIAMTSEIISYLLLETETANDFYSSAPTTIYEALWWGGYFNWYEGDPNVIAFNLRFYADAGGVPGSLIAEYPEAIPTETIALGQGPEGPIYEYHASVSVNIGEGSYWFSVQACDHAFPPQWGRLAAGQVTGSQATFRSEYFAYPDWTPSEQIWGVPLDASQRFYAVPSVPRACCFVDLHCEFLLPVDCLQLGGAWQGPGSTCDPNPCPSVPMACCFPDGHCEQLSQAACAEVGGSSGIGMSCDPNSCPQPAMACCLPDWHCEFITEDACRSEGGNPLGYLSTCDPNPCPSVPMACCFPDGHCEQLSQAACAEGGGSSGIVISCDPNPCPPPSMACCFPDGHCEFTTESVCLSEGGNPLGYPSTCEQTSCPQAGACCNPATGHCMVVTEDLCPPPSVWMGLGTACDPNPCPQPSGACCNPTTGDCTVTTQTGCRYTWHGAGTTCTPNPCQEPVGACCNPTTGNCTVTVQANCSYDWHGAGTTCTPNPCPQPGGAIYYVRSDGSVPASPPYFPTIQAAINYVEP